MINAVRAEHGLRPIRVVPCLDALSESWGARMATEGLWRHRDMSAVVRACRLTWTGETLARGQFTPEDLVGMWMDSPPHRAILLTGRARLAGIDARAPAATTPPSSTWVTDADLMV
ncbi:CAP domain-containing protein [uncultured Nocardioides sp.]|uniref:CAP domain-containing protein n=1 Tax=uncultured Nocardioides sp. TaxID=198441 RepID=UPI0025F5C281|nr:CAP domain-containing protein [uncultured Nocardioides sp.]